MRKIGLVLALMFFGAGLIVTDWSAPSWSIVTPLLFSIPLLAQSLPGRAIPVYGIWFGVFLVLQMGVTALTIDHDFLTLPPNMLQRIEVVGDGLPGITGLQTITTDSLGFRVTKPVHYSGKTADTYRIFAIGASTTEQIFLDDQATWSHLLQSQLDRRNGASNFEVINTGVSGLRAVHHLATLKKIQGLGSDMAVILVGFNDWNRHIWDAVGWPDPPPPQSMRSYWKFNHSLLGGLIRRAWRGAPSHHSSETRIERGEFNRTVNDSLRRETVVRFRPQNVSDDYAKALQGIADQCRQWQMTCMFMTQPTLYDESVPERVQRTFWMTPPETDYTLDLVSLKHVADLYNDYLIEFSRRNELEFCDLANAMDRSFEFYYDECHFNTRGAETVARTVAECVDASMTRAPDGRP